MLKRDTSEQRLRKYLVYDLEWIPGTMVLRIVGVYDGKRYRCYRSIDAFLSNELTREHEGWWFYAHFGGGADVQFLLAELTYNPKYQHLYVDGCFAGSSLIIARLHAGHKVWHFLDSYSLIRMPLAKIGQWLGISKTGPDKETESARDWYATVSERELIEYNEIDCRILYHAIRAVESAIVAKGGSLHMTLASTAMHLFRRKYLSEDIPTSDTINKVAFRAYVASRVEVIAKECDHSWYYDINSCFPHAMTFPLPGRFKKYHHRLQTSMLSDDRPCLIRARVSVPDAYIPPLPRRLGNQIFFPYGEWEGWYSNIDLALLLDCGGDILEVFEVIEFHPNHDMERYAHDMYNARLAATSQAESITYKLLGNGLYGKTAEGVDKLRLHLHPTSKVLSRLNREDNMKMPGVWVEPTVAKVPHAHVPLAMQITAIGRRSLFRQSRVADEVYYFDTDGFGSSDRVPEGKEIGAVKLEKIVEHGMFLAPKVYSLQAQVKDRDGNWKQESIYKAKGFSLGEGKKAAKRFSDLVSGMDIQIERMRRIRENISRGSMVPQEVLILKRLQDAVLPKRCFYPDGSSRPWNIEEIEPK